MKDRKLTIFFSHGVSLKTWINLGVFKRRKDIYSYYVKEFSSIEFITYDRDPELLKLTENCNYHINKYSIPARIYQLLIPFIHRKVLANSDVYLTVQMSGSYAAVISKLFYGVPLVIHCGYSLSKHAKRGAGKMSYLKAKLLEKISFLIADRIIVTSRTHHLKASADKSIKDKIYYIPNSINTEVFRPLPVEKQRNSISCVAKFSKQKNLFVLIRVAAELKLKLKLIGSGPLKNELIRYAELTGAEVDFIGNVPNEEIPGYLCSTELFVFPSFYEGSPKALLEAMACGMPIVASDIDEHREIVRHMDNALLTGTSFDEVRESVSLLISDNTLRASLGCNASKYIEENYNMAELVPKAIAVIKSAIKS